MHLYLLFLVMAAATVLSPGPGVVMTLTNALRYGLRSTFGGILGIAVGALVVAILSLYAVFSSRARRWLTFDRGGRAISRTSGVTPILFRAVLSGAKP